jgi:excisionase family DNA binding protein
MIQVVTITTDELLCLVKRACSEAVIEASRKAAATVERVGAAEAARLVNKRRSLVLDALTSKALPAIREGRNWKIKVGDLDAWASAGYPSHPKTSAA